MLTSALEAIGERQALAGNTPLLLTDPTSAYVVRDGRVEVFAVTLDGATTSGPRRHYVTALAGDILFGVDSARIGQRLGLLAVGAVGTTLIRVQVADLARLQGVAELRDAVTQAIERWVTGLSAGLGRTIVPQPRAEVTLAPGESASILSGQRIRPARDVIWLRHSTGQSLLIGMEDIAGQDAGVPVPLTLDTYVQALGAGDVAALSTADVVQTRDVWPALDAFYDALFRCEVFNSRLADADELNRLNARASRDDRARRTAIADLKSVLTPEDAAFAGLDTDQPLLAASALVAGALGMRIKAPPPTKEESVAADPVGDIARASRLRIRQVALKGRWWRSASTALLAFRADGSPVALVPSSNGRFRLHDPMSRTILPVTETVAATLQPQAHVFYPALPEGPLGLRDLHRFGLRGKPYDIVWPLALSLAIALLALLTPLITGRIVGSVIPEAARSELVQLVSILATVTVASAMLDVARRIMLIRFETKTTATIQSALWDRVLTLPAAFFRRYNAGDLATRIGAVDKVRQAITGQPINAMLVGLFSAVYLLQLFYYSWRLALIALAVVAFLVLVLAICAWVKLRLLRQAAAVEGRLIGFVLQLLAGIAKIRVAAAESRALAEWAKRYSQQKRLALRAGMGDAALTTVNGILPLTASLGMFALMWYLTDQAIDDGETPMSIGDFVAFNAAFTLMLAQLVQGGMAVMAVVPAIPMLERVRPLTTEAPEVNASKSDPGDLNGRIEVSHVSFRYRADGPLVLNDVSLEFPPGRYVAIVGPSGSGKSSLLRLMLGLDTPENGAIYYDGRDLAQLDVHKLRRKIGVVVQNGRIRQGSIFDNIVGSIPLTLDDAWAAARMAGLTEDIEQMPMGMHTVLQPGGGQLSGGQRQRVMIARAIVNRPRILFFDEATSALDNRTQAIVADSLQALQATRVAIAHRLSTIVSADRIYVMSNGQVVQSGGYQELLDQGGLFGDLVRRQVA